MSVPGEVPLLSERLRDYIGRHPGTFEDRIIADVTLRSELTSDTERVLEVLIRTGQVYTCEIWDDRRRDFESICYLRDQVPIIPENPALMSYDDMIPKEDCRCAYASTPVPLRPWTVPRPV